MVPISQKDVSDCSDYKRSGTREEDRKQTDNHFRQQLDRLKWRGREADGFPNLTLTLTLTALGLIVIWKKEEIKMAASFGWRFIPFPRYKKQGKRKTETEE